MIQFRSKLFLLLFSSMALLTDNSYAQQQEKQTEKHKVATHKLAPTNALTIIADKVKNNDATLSVSELNTAVKWYAHNNKILAELYYYYAMYYMAGNTDSCHKYYALAMSMATQANNDSLKAELIILDADMHPSDSSYPMKLAKADELAQKTGSVSIHASVSEKLGAYYYERNPDRCVHFMRIAIEDYSQRKDMKRVAQCQQNIAMAYQEQKHDYANAVEYAQRAMNTWKEMNNKHNEADMMRFLGLAQTKNGQFMEGKPNLTNAIHAFMTLKSDEGLAVAYMSIASFFEQVHTTDSAKYYLQLSKNIWEKMEQNRSQKMFEINNAYMRIAMANNKLGEAYDYFMENQPQESAGGIYWRERLKFLSYASNYYNKTGNKKAAAEYQSKYIALKSSYSQKGYYVE